MAVIVCTGRALLVRLGGVLLVLACLGSGASAQIAAPNPFGAAPAAAAEPLPDTPEAARALVARLSDAEVRALLLDRLDAVARERARAAEEGGLGATLAEAADSFAAAVGGALVRVGNIPAGVAEGVGRFYAPRGAPGTAHLIAVGLFALGLAALVERGLRRVAPRVVPPDPATSGLGDTLRFLIHRLGVEAAGVAVFMAVAWAVIALAHPPEPISFLILIFFLTLPVLYARVAGALSRFLLAPRVPAHRLLDLDDATAAFLHRAIVIFGALVGLRAYVLSFLGGHGVDLAAMRLGFWLTLVLYGWLFYVAWAARGGLARMLTGEAAPDSVEARAARAYPYVAMALVALFWAITEVFTGAGLWHLLDERLPVTLAVLIFAPVVDLGLRRLAAHAAPDPAMPDPRAADLAGRTRRALVRMGRVAAFGLVLIGLVDLWNADLAMAAMGPMPVRLAAGLVEALGVIAVGYFLVEAATLWAVRRLAAELPAEPAPEADAGGEGGAAGGSRVSTVLPLGLRVVQVAIVLVTALEALSALGVSIAPLLAGLGILGLAIGFGAQKLVADVVSGVFFLIDDAFRVGEYVEIDDTRGTVERISVRSLQLRHHEGAVHTIPFGDIPRLTNYSRDWVIMKLRFTVPFDTDLNKVKKLFKTIGREMADDPAFADDFLQPFKSQGVIEVDDVGLVVRGKFMAKPGRQWTLRKEIFARVQRVFEENDIQFARREVRVKIDGEAGPEAARRAAAAAAETTDDAVAAR